MKIRTIFLAASTLACSAAHSAIIFSSTFSQAEGYTPGPLHGQLGWFANAVTVSDVGGITVQTTSGLPRYQKVLQSGPLSEDVLHLKYTASLSSLGLPMDHIIQTAMGTEFGNVNLSFTLQYDGTNWMWLGRNVTGTHDFGWQYTKSTQQLNYILDGQTIGTEQRNFSMEVYRITGTTEFVPANQVGGFHIHEITLQTVPEPASASILLLGLFRVLKRERKGS